MDINLRGIGQVMFQDNPLTGALFLIAIAWGSYAAGVPQVAIAGSARGRRCHPDGAMASRRRRVAERRALWLQRHPRRPCAGDLSGSWAAALGVCVLGAAVSVVAMLGTANVVKPWGWRSHISVRAHNVASLVGHVWIFRPRGAALPSGNVVTAVQPYQASPLHLIDLVQGVLQSISQVFLKGSGIVGRALCLRGWP